jgi:MFS transporter, FHS family, glucose/mannose:H+ symporter
MPLRRGLLSGAAFAGMFVFGIVMALLGAVLPALGGRLRFDVADIGTLFLVMNFAMLVCSLIAGVAMDRFGTKPPMFVGPLLVAAALSLITRAGVFADLLPAVALLGFGGGALNASTNTLVADLHEDAGRKSSALNLLGVFFGFGALCLPFAIGALIGTLGIDVLLWIAAALCAAAGLFAALLRFPEPKQKNRLPVAEMRRFIGAPLVLAMAFLLFFQSGIEFTLGGYITTFLMDPLGAEIASASWILAGYWGAIMIARVFLSRLLLKVKPHAVVLACALGAAAGASITAAAQGFTMAAFGIVVTGFSLSGIYPTVLGIAGTHYRSHSGTVFGILFTIALVGGMTMPWVAGHFAGAVGIRSVFVLVAGAFLAIAILNSAARSLAKQVS